MKYWNGCGHNVIWFVAFLQHNEKQTMGSETKKKAISCNTLIAAAATACMQALKFATGRSIKIAQQLAKPQN